MRETVELEFEKLRLPLAFWALLVNGLKSKEKKVCYDGLYDFIQWSWSSGFSRVPPNIFTSMIH